MIEHDSTLGAGFEVSFTATFCFTVARAQVEGKSPFEAAALLGHRLKGDGFFIFGAGVELEAADRTGVREASFKPLDYDFLAGLFTGGESVVEDYLRSVPPEERADWSPPEDDECEG
ncbi:hypothetical protein [Paludisphaera soli]|uniref:hypothetical protein n=1 Tax=Paludisphaera soli TaxID=2712865 RepID=UPI0013EDFA84|nr:hypothetical protein [Paludisphaera soli]